MLVCMQKMKKQLYISGIIFFILSIVNFFGAVTNELLNYSGNLTDDFHETFILVGIFCGLYLLTTRIKTKLDNSLKLPIIRSILWTIFVSTELFTEPTLNGEPSYILFLNNSGLCTFWNTIFISIPGGVGQNFFVDNILINIVAFGLYEIAIIRIAISIYHKVINKKHDTPTIKL